MSSEDGRPVVTTTITVSDDPSGPRPGECIGDLVRITRCPEGFNYVGAEGRVVDIITGGVWVIAVSHRLGVGGWNLAPGHRVAALAVGPVGPVLWRSGCTHGQG